MARGKTKCLSRQKFSGFEPKFYCLKRHQHAARRRYQSQLGEQIPHKCFSRYIATFAFWNESGT